MPMPRDGTPTRTKCHAAPRLARVASAGWAAVALRRSLHGLLHRCNVASLHRCVVASVHRCVVASWTPRRDRLAVDRIAVDSRFAVSPPATPITPCVRVRVRAGSAHARVCVCQRECMRVCTRSARLGSARLGSARLGSARLGSARLGSHQYMTSAYNCDFRRLRREALKLAAAPQLVRSALEAAAEFGAQACVRVVAARSSCKHDWVPERE